MKKKKNLVRLHAAKYFWDKRGIYPVLMVLLITQQFNVLFNSRNENTFHRRLFEINDKHDMFTNGSDIILMQNLYNVLCCWN